MNLYSKPDAIINNVLISYTLAFQKLGVCHPNFGRLVTFNDQTASDRVECPMVASFFDREGQCFCLIPILFICNFRQES